MLSVSGTPEFCLPLYLTLYAFSGILRVGELLCLERPELLASTRLPARYQLCFRIEPQTGFYNGSTSTSYPAGLTFFHKRLFP